MDRDSFLKTPRSNDSRIFEIGIVLSLIAFCIWVATDYYDRSIKSSERARVEFHSGIFARMMSNLYAIGKTQNDGSVDLGKTTFYLNELGWPANTDKSLSPSLRDQTEEECQQLWNAAYLNPPESGLSENRNNQDSEYIISLYKKRICRYSLFQKEEENVFFDYDLISGEISLSN